MNSELDWQLRCRELDRFRWLQLRQRHGIAGSAMRLGRELLLDLWFGWRARARLSTDVQAEPCDLLLLQASPEVIGLNRKRLFKQALRARGHTLTETALDEPSQLVLARQLCQPAAKVPLRYFGYAAHAQWLVERYRPRLLLNDRNGSLFSPFLRLALNQRGSQLVQLAHATTVESSRRLDMTDYDYYFLFGRSSLEALQARPLRFGTCRAVLTGSHMIDASYDLPPADPAARTLLILGVGPDKEKEAGYQQTYQLLRDWAASTVDYQVLVKAHPRSKVPFWQQAAAELDNLQVLPADCTLAEALGRSSLVVNIMSNAVIEAALAGRPLLYVNASGEQDIFEQERFLGTCIHSSTQLAAEVQRVSFDFAAAVARSEAMAEHHLAHGPGGLQASVSAVEQLLRGEEPAAEWLVACLRSGWAPQVRCSEMAFVINLDSRPDRWLRMQEVLNLAGLQAERLRATGINDMLDTPAPDSLRHFLLEIDGQRADSEHKLQATWACMHSHLDAIRRARDAGADSVLILEDDCEFESFSPFVLEQVVRQLQQQSWDMLYLGGTRKKSSRNVPVSTNLRAVSRIRLAHAYVVRSSLYQRILDEAPVSGLPLDWYYSEVLQADVRALMVEPLLANQRLNDCSDIEGVKRRPKLKSRKAARRLLAMLRYH